MLGKWLSIYRKVRKISQVGDCQIISITAYSHFLLSLHPLAFAAEEACFMCTQPCAKRNSCLITFFQLSFIAILNYAAVECEMHPSASRLTENQLKASSILKIPEMKRVIFTTIFCLRFQTQQLELSQSFFGHVWFTTRGVIGASVSPHQLARVCHQITRCNCGNRSDRITCGSNNRIFHHTLPARCDVKAEEVNKLK